MNLLQSLIQNPDPNCEKDCRFSYGPSSTTAAYYAPIYDKNGVNVNPDGNVTRGSVTCSVCGRAWDTVTQFGQTRFDLREPSE